MAIVKTRAELIEWRERVLAKVSMPKERLYELAENCQLRPDERAIFELVRTIDEFVGDGPR